MFLQSKNVYVATLPVSDVLFNNVSIFQDNLDNYLRLSPSFPLLFRPSVRPFVPAFSLLQELSSVAVLHLTPVPSPVPSPSLPLVRVGVAASIPSSFATAADIHSNSEGLGSLAICKGQGLPFIQQVVFICHISGLSLIVFRLFF